MKKLAIVFFIVAGYAGNAQVSDVKSDSIRLRPVHLPNNVINAKPLYLVDSVERSDKCISSIPVSQIESISVLKYSASLAFYGEKARFGLVSIKLKSSKQ